MIDSFIKFKVLTVFIKEFFALFILSSVLINSTNIISQEDTVQKSSQLEAVLNWTAKDSIILDMVNKQTYLYNDGHIDYGEIILDACFIKFDFESKTVYAKYCLDSNNQKIGKPILSDGSTSTTSDSLKYNFKTKKGITYEVKLQEGESYIHGQKVKRQNQKGKIRKKTEFYRLNVIIMKWKTSLWEASKKWKVEQIRRKVLHILNGKKNLMGRRM